MPQNNPFDRFDGGGPRPVTLGTPNANKQEKSDLNLQEQRLRVQKLRNDMPPDDAPIVPNGETGDAFLKKLAPGDAAIVKGLANGTIQFPTGASLKAPYWQKMLANVVNYDPTFDQVNYGARAATRKDFTSGKSAMNIKALNTAIGHLGQLNDQIAGTASGTGYPLATTINGIRNSVSENMGDPGPTLYEQTAGSVASELTQVFRGSGGAEADVKRYLGELDPNASLPQKQAAIKNIMGLLKSRLDAIGDQYTKGMGTTAQPLELLDDHAKSVTAKILPDGSPSPLIKMMNEGAIGEGPRTGGLSGQFKTVDRPGGQETYDTAIAMVRRGDSLDDVANYARSRGLNITNEAWKPVFDAREKTGLTNFAPSPGWLHMDVPLTQDELQQNISAADPQNVAMSNFTNGVAAGLPRAVATSKLFDPSGDRARALEGADAQHPIVAGVANAVGNAAGAAATEAGAAKGLMALPIATGLQGAERAAAIAPWAARAGDTAFGAASGAAASPDDPLKGAAIGAGTGLVGGQVARTVGGGLVSPTGGAFGEFAGDGIRPTLGQRFGQSGVAGNVLNTGEQALESVPIVGAAVRGARAKGVESWERVGYNRALKAIDEEPLPKNIKVGPDAMKFVGDKMDAVYDKARSGMTFVPDSQFANDFGAWQQTVRNGQVAGDDLARIDKIISNTVGSRIRGGSISGDAYKTATSDLSKTIAGISSPEVKSALKDFNNLFKSAALRNSKPEAANLMQQADNGWAQFKPLRDASAMAGSEPGRFTPTALASTERRFNGKSRAYIEGNTKLDSYVKRGMDLRDTLGNSGTADRQIVSGLALTAAGAAGAPIVPKTALALTLPYMPIARDVVAKALMPRDSAVLRAGGDALRKYGGPLGVLGASPLASAYDDQPVPVDPGALTLPYAGAR